MLFTYIILYLSVGFCILFTAKQLLYSNIRSPFTPEVELITWALWPIFVIYTITITIKLKAAQWKLSRKIS